MKTKARFEKVSMNEWMNTLHRAMGNKLTKDDEALWKESYESIMIPRRSTTGSMGYDFFMPYPIEVYPMDGGCVVPTGIKVYLEDEWGLIMTPRSGLGHKYKMSIDGTLGIIDADYYNNPKNEGHIMITVNNNLMPISRANPITGKAEIEKGCIMTLEAKMAFVQGLLVPYGIAENEIEPTKERNGGFGSTDKSSSVPSSGIILS